MGPQLACDHVLDHALTQRADGGIGTHGELLLSEDVETSIFPQDGAPRPHYGLLSTGYQPSIGHPAQRLSRQRFRALARTYRRRLQERRILGDDIKRVRGALVGWQIAELTSILGH